MRDWKGWAIGGVSALLSLYCFGLLYEGFISDHYSGFLTYPFVDKPAAERAYDRLAPNAPMAERAQAARRLIEADPSNPESWNAVAYTDWLAHGGLSPVGLTAFGHSYTLSFFDRPSAVWRVSFALENWPSLTPDIRKAALAEAKVVLHDPALGPELRRRISQVQNPDGLLAGKLLLAMYPS